eukprot:3938905-Amphidinium_carterae.1
MAVNDQQISDKQLELMALQVLNSCEHCCACIDWSATCGCDLPTFQSLCVRLCMAFVYMCVLRPLACGSAAAIHCFNGKEEAAQRHELHRIVV